MERASRAMGRSSSAGSVREYCLGILESGRLEDKLVRPWRADGSALPDDDPGRPQLVDRPARSEALRMRSGAGRLPSVGHLRDPAARTLCLERFAHHELMAVELFAWALVAWPDMPVPLRRGFLRVLAEEQDHLEHYLVRLDELGSSLGATPLSDYFWRHTRALADHPAGARAFLSFMGLTLEQANLDFTLTYADAFDRHGDEPSSRLMRQVHEDEIGHVRLAVHWLLRLDAPGRSLIDAYVDSVPFPLSAARAKGRRFDVAARRRAGMDDAYIEFVRAARPYDEPGGSRP